MSSRDFVAEETLRQQAEEGSARLPDTLQSFLSHVGVVNPAAVASSSSDVILGNNNDTTEQIISDENGEESIFESILDLTAERLQYVFDMFDADKDGRISYETLRNGIEFHTAGLHDSSLLDETSFQQLVKYLDLDGSGDISFEEFSEGIRLLMLRNIVLCSSSEEGPPEEPSLEVIDYEPIQFERKLVFNRGAPLPNNQQQGTMDSRDFYFQRRADWVKTRWINVYPSSPVAASAMDMKRLAIKYLLHPLALEDALSPEIQRPKAELYSNHYFIMIPVFDLEWTTLERNPSPGAASSFRKTVKAILCFFPVLIRGWFQKCKKDPSNRTETTREKPGIKHITSIRVRLVSIFVNVPKDDTIITFTNNGVHATTLDMSSSGFKHHLWRRVQHELEKSYSKLRQYDAQYLTYALLDEAVDLIHPIVKKMRHEIEQERDYLEKKNSYRNLKRIHKLKSELEKMGRRLKPFTRLLTHMIEDDAIKDGVTVYLRDVLDNLESAEEEVKQLIVDCESVDSDADKFQSQQMDSTLYALTVISAVFLPAQFLTGVYGMNFTHMPELSEEWAYPTFWILSVFLMVTLFVALNFGRLKR